MNGLSACDFEEFFNLASSFAKDRKELFIVAYAFASKGQIALFISVNACLYLNLPMHFDAKLLLLPLLECRSGIDMQGNLTKVRNRSMGSDAPRDLIKTLFIHALRVSDACPNYRTFHSSRLAEVDP